MDGIILSLGSNLGNRQQYLNQAIKLIEEQIGNVVEASSVIETKSWGFDSADFLNQVIRIETKLSPIELLDKLQEIEIQLGRTHKRDNVFDTSDYADRTIDIDILFYNGEVINTERLTIPHPYIEAREFFHPLLHELNILNY